MGSMGPACSSFYKVLEDVFMHSPRRDQVSLIVISLPTSNKWQTCMSQGFLLRHLSFREKLCNRMNTCQRCCTTALGTAQARACHTQGELGGAKSTPATPFSLPWSPWTCSGRVTECTTRSIKKYVLYSSQCSPIQIMKTSFT